ncbi:hypothetical protein AURDEDRAFT_177483 [Auricularia subglabra TFB-10046 SS5]|uniref:F-box domain-containing protein n=1 Tax=Auricularia subglabra (strain TFB-10046 / SS5) TaxID=717982 RepID=J0WM96_AURST|nr:hypothetical protein AURDEDRAFT_177483 [Auricularia subglabra TFB-10046 SS5]
MVRNAASTLNDPSRPLHLLMQYVPAPKSESTFPRECGCITDILGFHSGERINAGRFPADYRAACDQLDLLVFKFEFILPSVVLRPTESDSSSPWTLTVMRADWSGPTKQWDDYIKHDLWFDLYCLRQTLLVMPNPKFQQMTFSKMPADLKRKIFGHLCVSDVRRIAAVSKEICAICEPTLVEHAQVSMWYNHAYLSHAELRRLRFITGAPATPFGFSVSSFWGWFRERRHNDLLKGTRSLSIRNRWQWAAWVYAESCWAVRGYETTILWKCMEAGLSMLPSLKSLSLSFLLLSADVMAAIARIPTLRGLSLTGCGITTHDYAVTIPAMVRLRELRVTWDPLSAMESMSADMVLRLVPNVARLCIANRIRSGPALALRTVWTPALPRLETLATIGVDVSVCVSLLRRCLSCSIRDVHVQLRSPATVAQMRGTLALITPRTRDLASLVLEGFVEPDLATLAMLGHLFPDLRCLAVLPRRPNQASRTSVSWHNDVHEVALALANMTSLEHLAVNVACAADAVGPACLDFCFTPAAEHMTTADDGMDEYRAAALPFSSALRKLRAVDLVADTLERGMKFEVVRRDPLRIERMMKLSAGWWDEWAPEC